MGFRFRKSFKIAPGVKLNLGKKSAGISVGGKGFRKSFSTSGRSTTSIGVPGTGLSYVSTSSGSSKNNESSVNNVKASSKSKGKSGCWIIAVPILIVFFILGGIKSCIDSNPDSSIITTSYKTNIESIEFANNVPVNLVVGDSIGSYIKVEYDVEFSENDIVFVSSAPDIATITFDRKGYQNVYFDLNAVSAGTVTIYAGTKDGLVMSEEIIITVTDAETTTEEETTEQETKTTVVEKTTPNSETTARNEVTSTKEKTTLKTESDKKITTTQKESNGKKEPANNKEYVLNTNTKKIHYGSCSSVEDIKPENYSKTTDYDKAIAQGYVPCKRCNP